MNIIEHCHPTPKFTFKPTNLVLEHKLLECPLEFFNSRLIIIAPEDKSIVWVLELLQFVVLLDFNLDNMHHLLLIYIDFQYGREGEEPHLPRLQLVVS